MSKYGDYVLFTDSTCDLPDDIAKKYDINILPMGFLMEEKAYNHFLDAREMSLDEFYSKLKSGIQSQTTQIAFNTYSDYWEPFLKDGKDIVYIAFSSALSGTYNTSKIAARDLLEKYPDRNITIIDSASASAGQGALMYYVGKKYKNDNPDSDTIAAYAENLKLKICHWFVVDDIDQLKRGGRISSVTATFAKALQIKPVLSIDNDGKLINVGKIRGANNINDLLIKKMERDAVRF
nr:DegV family protein [Ruminococcus sp.]